MCITIMYTTPISTERFWEVMHNLTFSGQFNSDDQVRLNNILSMWHIKWSMSEPHAGIPIAGKTKTNALKVVLLPETDICRVYCNNKSLSEYYVWHPRLPGLKDKIQNLKQIGMWHVPSKWDLEEQGNSTGIMWLHSFLI